MFSFRFTVRIWLLAVLAAGQGPLWLHEFTAHRASGPQASASGNSCSSCAFHGHAAQPTDEPSITGDEDCSICYQLSQATSRSEFARFTQSTAVTQLCPCLPASSLLAEPQLYSARGPPTA